VGRESQAACKTYVFGTLQGGAGDCSASVFATRRISDEAPRQERTPFVCCNRLETVVEWTISASSSEKESRGCFIRCSIESHHLAVSLPSEPVYQVISNRMFDVPDNKLRNQGWFLIRWCVILL
jgi:hypothetical protein